MKILLIYPQIRAYHKAHRFPAGLGYISAALKKNGHKVDVLDLNMERMSEKKIYAYLSERLKDYNVVGISGLVTVFVPIRAIINMVKEIEPDIPVLVGGPVASYSSEIVLNETQVDIVVLGEAEKTTVSLLSVLEEQGDLSSVKGIGYRRDGVIKYTEPTERQKDLDSIPFPSYESFNIEQYIRNFKNIWKKRGVNIIASRGCPFSCVFCARNFGTGIYYRSVESVLEEIEMLIKNWRIEAIWFNDELFVANKKWVHDFCDQVIKRKLKLRFSATGKVNCVDKDLLLHLKKAGFVNLMYGVESFNEGVLKEMNKKNTKEQIVQAIEWAKEVGIRIDPGFIIGMPSETQESVNDTINLCKRFGFSLDGYSFITPYPGAVLYNQCVKNGAIKDELKFIESLNDADITKFSLNLTQWSDAELMRVRENAIKEVRQHLDSKSSHKNFLTSLKNKMANTYKALIDNH